MDYNQFRNTMREWVRTKVAADATLNTLDLVTPNEQSDHGPDDYWLRYGLQTSQDAELIGGGGPGQRLHRRYGRATVEVFGPQFVGEGQVSQYSARLEAIFQAAMLAPASPDPLIYIQQPSTFERPEDDRYCQVVSVPVQVDTIS